MVKVTWLGGMAFESVGATGNSFTMDATTEAGGDNRGPSPVEALIGSLAACTGIDIISILNKKRTPPSSYRLEVHYVKETGDWPRPVTSAVVTHIIEGDVDPEAVAQAIRLSEDKYCSVSATLKIPVQISVKGIVNETPIAP